MSNVFAKGDKDLGYSSETQHEIKLTDTKLVKQRCRWVPPGQSEEFREAVKDLLEAGAIRESKGPYSSPVVRVRKKDKALRICADFRQLNRKTIKDAYPIPRIKETLESLQGAKWFCAVNCKVGTYKYRWLRKIKQKREWQHHLAFMNLIECHLDSPMRRPHSSV